MSRKETHKPMQSPDDAQNVADRHSIDVKGHDDMPATTDQLPLADDVLPADLLPTLERLSALLADPALEAVWRDAVDLQAALVSLSRYSLSKAAMFAIADRLRDAAASPASREAAAMLVAFPPPTPKRPHQLFTTRYDAILHHLAVTALRDQNT